MSLRASRNLEVRSAETRASSYDQFSAFLYASIAVIGLVVFIMFLIWLTLREYRVPNTIIPAMTVAGNNNRPEGIADDWQPPGVEEFPEVEEPQLADALEKTTDAVSTVRAQLEAVDGEAMEMGKGTGLGDARQSGPGDGNGDVVPESERLAIEYSAGSMQEYMNILDYFQIQLAGVSKRSDQIHYVSDLISASPTSTVGVRGQETRLGFQNTKSRLRRWDFNKLNQAGIPTDRDDKYAVQYYSETARQELLTKERAEYEAAGRTLMDVQRTRFNVRASGGGYEFVVVDITYR